MVVNGVVIPKINAPPVKIKILGEQNKMEEAQMTYVKASKKFLVLSEKYHRLSQLFYELSQSIKLEGHRKSEREFKKYMKMLNLDLKKIMNLSQDVKNLELDDLQKSEELPA